MHKLERHFYTTSSCGVCGKTSIEAIKVLTSTILNKRSISVSSEIIHSLPLTLNENQKTFAETGGLHASALFDREGNLLSVREDVGRHNALDKLIGASMFKGMLPLQDHLLLLSGRASFELIQKAAMAGITFVCAVGAPSSLAVELAMENNITLFGFCRLFSEHNSQIFQSFIFFLNIVNSKYYYG
jgi:FdhD protein